MKCTRQVGFGCTITKSWGILRNIPGSKPGRYRVWEVINLWFNFWCSARLVQFQVGQRVFLRSLSYSGDRRELCLWRPRWTTGKKKDSVSMDLNFAALDVSGSLFSLLCSISITYFFFVLVAIIFLYPRLEEWYCVCVCARVHTYYLLSAAGDVLKHTWRCQGWC